MIALRERNTPCLGGQVCRLEIQKFVRGATWLPANALKPVTQDTIARAHRLTALLRSRRDERRYSSVLPEQRYIRTQHSKVCLCQAVNTTTRLTRTPARDIERGSDNPKSRKATTAARILAMTVGRQTTCPSRKNGRVASGSDVSGLHAAGSLVKANPLCVDARVRVTIP